MTEEELRREISEAHKTLDQFGAAECDEERESDGVVYRPFRQWSLSERIANLKARSYARGYNAAKGYGYDLRSACEQAAQLLNRALTREDKSP